MTIRMRFSERKAEVLRLGFEKREGSEYPEAPPGAERISEFLRFQESVASFWSGVFLVSAAIVTETWRKR